MPLIPLNPPTEDIEIGGDIYTLKTMVSAFERDQYNPGPRLQMPFGKVKDGLNMQDDDVVDLALADTAVVNIRKLKIWLVGWSLPEGLTSANLRRLPPSHAAYILKRIGELEKAQDGPAPNSPLPVSSNGSSGEASFTDGE